MSTFTLAMLGRCPQPADGRLHICHSGDSADLISFGPPEHGVSIYLGRCRYRGVSLPAVTQLSEDLHGAGPVLEGHEAQR